MEPHLHAQHKHKTDPEELSEIYSASERKKGSRAPWTSQDMISAMLLVKQGMSITKAAQSLNIPRTTLRDRVTGKVRSAKRAASTTALSAQDERALLDYYKVMRKQGYGRAKEMIMFMAGKAVRKNGNVLGEPFPNIKWWQSFCVRHNQPLTPEAEELYGMPRQRVNEVFLSNCTQQLFEGLTSSKYGINFLERPELIFSCNENTFDLDDMKKLLSRYKADITKDGPEGSEDLKTDIGEHSGPTIDGKILVSLEEDVKNFKTRKTSVITCVNALGQSLPPLFVHCTDNRETSRGSYEKYAQDRFDEDYFLLWFHDVFLQSTARRGPCILIYDGQNCLVTREMLMAAAVNDVLMFCIPAILSRELQPVDLAPDGMFTDAWKVVAANCDFDDGPMTSHSFTEIFKEFWSSVSAEVVITERFKTVGVYPFSRQTVAPANLNNVFEGDDFGHERLNTFLGPDSDANLQGRRKDNLINIAMKNPRNSFGNSDRPIDGNQNFLTPTGRLTRPTMSILNQPLTDAPMITPIINNEEEFREDFPEITNSADEFSSCSDEGSTSMVALSSSITNLPNSLPQKSTVETLTPAEHVISPTMAPQKRLHMTKLPEVNTYERHMLSPPGPLRNAVPQFQRVVYSSPGAVSRKRSSPYPDGRPTAPKGYPLSTVPFRNVAPEARSDIFPRGPPNASELHAFEEVLDQVRKAKFQKAFDDSLDNTEDMDPLYQLWKSLKTRFMQSANRVECNQFGCHVNQVSPSIIEITPKPTLTSASSDARHSSCNQKRGCQCGESFRTILTPAGNLSVNKNATVIVIMPEKQEENPPTFVQSGNTKEQNNRSTSV